ncbi:hypothetical protein AB0J43_02105 [Nonomuraea fuscirosea]
MTWNSGPCLSVPEPVVVVLDEINARVGWPRGRPDLCVGHMVSDHRPIDGIDVSIGEKFVEVRVVGVLVGRGNRWIATGNAYICCLLPHTWPDSDCVSALHQGGAIKLLWIRQGPDPSPGTPRTSRIRPAKPRASALFVTSSSRSPCTCKDRMPLVGTPAEKIDLEKHLKAGEGIQFRLFDSDGGLDYVGFGATSWRKLTAVLVGLAQ